MSLATIVVLCLAVLFFGGIVYLERVSRKSARQEPSAEPIRLAPRDRPAGVSKQPVTPSAGTAAFQPKVNHKNKKKHRNGSSRRAPDRVAS